MNTSSLVPQSPQLPNTCSIDLPSISKRHSSEYLLHATYFDIGIIRTLFSSSWLTDGYIWCLEYIHKRLMDISDEILSDRNLSSEHLKSYSISQLNNLNEENFYKTIKKSYFNEQITDLIFEKQCIMTTTTFNSNQQQSILLNIPFQYSLGKKSFKNISKRNSDYLCVHKREKK